jgi:rhamnopyranosyl-N-acetylglucosaminyl-diphospho-decaprenol beta-1,3/1,4-galactofuranosyltransferase
VTADDMDTVQAIVLTYQAPDAVRRCIAAIAAQSRRVDEILIVDNDGGSSGVADAEIDPRVRVLAVPVNGGPAGGYAAGLTEFLAGDATLAWLMDDDCEPAPDALEQQLATRATGAHVVMATMVDDDREIVTNTHGWCAVLLERGVVTAVGVPNAELFWWTEDTEYLQWRIPRAGFALTRSEGAIVRVSRSRDDLEKPAWKYYYEARNQTYYRLHTQRVPHEGRAPRHLSVRVRWWRASRTLTKLTARIVTKESRHRGAKVAMVMRGTWDGARGRLGVTVRADSPDRPLIAT